MTFINLARGVEPGPKKLKIISIDEKFGPSGFPYLTLQLEVRSGDERGATFSDMLSLSPQSRFRVEHFLDAIGAPKRGKVGPEFFKGKIAWGEVGIDTTGEQPKPRVTKWMLPPETTEEDLLDDDEEEEEEDELSAVGAIPELASEPEDLPF